MTQKFSNRIVGSGVVNPAELYANPWNWRTHPKHQENAMSDILAKLGWIQEVIVNKTTGHLIDGHLRVETAVEQGESEIPVKYVELSESEEKLALATFDPISTLAGKDDEVLEELLAGIKTDTDIDIDTLFADVELSESEETDRANQYSSKCLGIRKRFYPTKGYGYCRNYCRSCGYVVRICCFSVCRESRFAIIKM